MDLEVDDVIIVPIREEMIELAAMARYYAEREYGEELKSAHMTFRHEDGRRSKVPIPVHLPDEVVRPYMLKFLAEEQAEEAAEKKKREEIIVKAATIRIIPQSGKQFVYFFRETVHGSIKIGTSRDPNSRIVGVQTGCPFPVVLLGVIEGNETRELSLHEKFSAYRLCGEWFSSDILDAVKAIVAEEGLREQPKK